MIINAETTASHTLYRIAEVAGVGGMSEIAGDSVGITTPEFVTNVL